MSVGHDHWAMIMILGAKKFRGVNFAPKIPLRT